MKFHPFKIHVIKKVNTVEEGIEFFNEEKHTDDSEYISLLSVNVFNKEVFFGDFYYDKQLKSYYMFSLKKIDLLYKGIDGFGIYMFNPKTGYKSFKKIKELSLNLDNLVYLGNLFIHKSFFKEINKHAKKYQDMDNVSIIDDNLKNVLTGYNFNYHILFENTNIKKNYIDSKENDFNLFKNIHNHKNDDFSIFMISKPDVLVNISKDELIKLEMKQNNLSDLKYSHKNMNFIYTGELQEIKEEYWRNHFKGFLINGLYMNMYDEDFVKSDIEEIVNNYNSGFYYMDEYGDILFKSTKGELPEIFKDKQLIHYNEYIYKTYKPFEKDNEYYEECYLKII